ncbi:hypothetical protein AB5I41_24615 [Sphingomonas sp. MMS24-JH45]
MTARACSLVTAAAVATRCAEAGRRARIGPDLTRLAERPTLGAGVRPMTTAEIARFVRDAPSVKPGMRMPAYDRMTNGEAVTIARWLEGTR